MSSNFEMLETLEAEREQLGTACPAFVHSFSETEFTPIYLHPQMIVDAKTVIEICSRFFENWQTRAE